MPKSYKFHCNLTSKNFPFSCDELSSTVFINQGREQNRQLLQGFDGRDVVDSFGICQTWFMSNVLPITRGFSSVYYKRMIESIPVELVNVFVDSQVPEQVIVLREEYNSSAILITAFGLAFVYDPQAYGWLKFTISGYTDGIVSHTYLKGKTYVCFAGSDIYSYNFETQQLVPVTFTGIVGATMLGVSSCLNYLITWDSQYIYWSSDVTPTDFVPSLSTGSGSSKLLAQKGVITCCLPIADGFIVYTTLQAIGATYSGDANDPWIFREISGADGVGLPEHVAYGTADDTHIAWTSSGFQAISLREAQPVWPELSDSIAREIYSGFSIDRTYNFGNLPIHENYGGLQTSETTFGHLPPNDTGLPDYITPGKYPFHFTAEPFVETRTVSDHVNWHAKFVYRNLITKNSVPTRIDWKGPFRLKVSAIGSRYIVVSVGVIQDKTFKIEDSGLQLDGDQYVDSFPLATSADVPQEDTPARVEIATKTELTEPAEAIKKFYDIAYVYDKALNRWGRLDCEHIDFLEFTVPQFVAQTTYAELLRRENATITEYPYRYQDFQSQATHDDYLATDNWNATEKVSYPWYYDNFGDVETNPAPVADITFSALGIEEDLRTSQFGSNFGVVSKDGGIFLVKLFDGKYFQEVQKKEGYDAAATLMRQEDESALGLNTLPHLCHGRYKVSRDAGSLLHGVSFSKIAAANIVSVWAIPHAEDGECLAPIPFTNIQTYSQTTQASNFMRLPDPNTEHVAAAQPAYSTQINWMMGDHGKFAGRAAGDSVSILIAGHFTLTDLTINLEAFGSRNMPVSNSLEAPIWWHVREVFEFDSSYDMNEYYYSNGVNANGG